MSWEWQPLLAGGQLLLGATSVPTFFAATSAPVVRARRTAPSWLMPSYFGPATTPAVAPVPTFFAAVFPPIMRAARGPRVSARRPFHFAPVDKPFFPDVAAFSAIFPVRVLGHARRSQFRPSHFGPSRIIDDAVVTPVGPAGSATFQTDVDSSAKITYTWVTEIQPFWSGLEHRMAIRSFPRQRYDFSCLVDDASMRQVLSSLAGNAANAPVFLLGLSHESLTVMSSTAIAITVGTLAFCDWAVIGQRIIVDSPLGTRGEAYITGVAGAVISTSADLSAFAVFGAEVMPAMAVYLDPDIPFGRYVVGAGRLDLVAYAALPGFGSAYPVGVGATVNTYEGNPVWDWGIGVNDIAAQPLHSGAELVDLGATLTSFGSFTEARWGRTIVMQSDAMIDFQFLKKFLNTVRGMSVSFLAPTGRPDFIPVGTAGFSTLMIIGGGAGLPNYVTDWFPSLAHRRIKLVKTDGTYAYRTISACVDNGNGTQTLTLDSALAGALARVEFLETVRLASDDVVVEWDGHKFSTTLSALVVQQ